VDGGLGWRHRFSGLEIAAAWRFVRPQGRYNTSLGLDNGRTWLHGASLEARWRSGTFSAGAGAERTQGTMPVQEQHPPDFAHVTYHEDASLTAASLFAAKSWKTTDLYFSVGIDRSRLPFVVMAVLGEETRALDLGYRPVSTTREVVWDLAVRQRVAPGVHVRAYGRMTQGGETVSLSDPAGALPPASIGVRRGGHSPFTQFTLGGGVDFSIGTARSGS
jgi:hypothetical protein